MQIREISHAISLQVRNEDLKSGRMLLIPETVHQTTSLVVLF